MANSHSLLLAGAGKMGSALLTRWQQKFPDCHFDVIEPNLTPTLTLSLPGGGDVSSPSPWKGEGRDGGQTQQFETIESLPADYSPDVIVFAVKPQELEKILPAYAKRFGNKPLYISIAAGKSLAFFAKHLGAGAKITRAMPNTPALVGHGMTVLVATPSLSEADKKIATQLMETVGIVAWLDESLMDAVTAVSGSGPAYVFLFMDALTKAGVNAGLPQDVSETLALQTIFGSIELARKSGESLEQLRKNVTSPGGTTEAALKILMKDDALEKLVKEAVLAAAKRSKELG